MQQTQSGVGVLCTPTNSYRHTYKNKSFSSLFVLYMRTYTVYFCVWGDYQIKTSNTGPLNFPL